MSNLVSFIRTRLFHRLLKRGAGLGFKAAGARGLGHVGGGEDAVMVGGDAENLAGKPGEGREIAGRILVRLHAGNHGQRLGVLGLEIGHDAGDGPARMRVVAAVEPDLRLFAQHGAGGVDERARGQALHARRPVRGGEAFRDDRVVDAQPRRANGGDGGSGVVDLVRAGQARRIEIA